MRDVWPKESRKLNEVKTMWRPYAWGKMILYETLFDLEQVIYIDTDVAFVGPIEGFWNSVKSMSYPTAFIASKFKFLYSLLTYSFNNLSYLC